MIFRREQYLIIVVFAILFLIMGGCLWFMADQTNKYIKESVRDELRGVSAVIADGIDGDTLAQFKPGDEQTPAFVRIRDQMNRLRSKYPAISSIYTMRKGASGIEFVVDADYGITSDAAVIGQLYPEANDQLRTGFLLPSADNDYTSDEWGVVLSGYAPVHDHNGTTVGIVGVDIDSSRVIARQQLVVTNFFLVAILALIIAVTGIVAAEVIRSKSITELENQKKYLDAILTAVPAGIMVIDAGTKQIVDLNQQAAALIGRPKEEIVGRVCHQFICPAETAKCPITDLGQTVDNAERVLLTPDGRNVTIIKTVRRVTLHEKEYLIESFLEKPDNICEGEGRSP